MTPLVRLLGALGLVAASACRALIGNLDECRTSADCASRGEGLVCQDNLCVAATPLPAECARIGSKDENAIVFGALLPMTTSSGEADARGQLRANAIEVAVTQLNPPQRTGIGGRGIAFIVCDTSGSPTRASRLAESLVSRGLPAILSASSAETIAVAAVTVPAGVLLMSSSASAPEISTLQASSPLGVRLVWRTAPSDAIQGQALANLVTSSTLERVAVVALNDAYGQGLATSFRTHYAREKTTLFYDRGGDLTDTVARASGYAPHAVLMIGFPDDAVRFANAAHATSKFSSVRWFFSDAAKSPTLLSGLDNPSMFEGAKGTAPATAERSLSDAFIWFRDQFQSVYGIDPSVTASLANTFDATMLFAVAAGVLSDEGEAPSGVRMAQILGRVSASGAPRVPLDPPHFSLILTNMKLQRSVDVAGASGPLDFDEMHGEAPAPIEIWSISAGAFVTESVVTP